MRTPTRHRNPRTGEVYYRVRYRRLGHQHALTFYGEQAQADAAEFAGLLEQLGPDRAVSYWNAHLDDAPMAMTVDEYFGRHLKSITRITEGTKLTYQRIYDRIWKPTIGSRPLDAVAEEDIAEVINDLSTRQGKSDKTVKNAYGVIASMFKTAVRRNLIPATPCANIRMPRRTEHVDTEMRFLAHAEWEHLVAHLPAGLVPLFTTLIGTGMRWGEAEALTVADVVVAPSSVIHITKAAKWNASKATREIGPTKTKRSKRTVTLPVEVLEVLTPLLDRPRRDRLFLAVKGGELRHSKVYEAWTASCIAAGIGEWIYPDGPGSRRKWDGPRIHDLRHTHVAWLIAAGVPLPVIQARLGHESIQTTIDRYGHLLPDLQQAAAFAASVAMRPRSVSQAAPQVLPLAAPQMVKSTPDDVNADA